MAKLMSLVGNLALGCMASILALQAPAQAQPFPSKPVRVLVPFGPGSGADIVVRFVADGLTSQLKQPVVVENRDGAGGILGAQTVLRAPADGYTVMGIPGTTYLIAPQLSKTPPFDPIKDFTAVAKVAYVPMILVTSSQSQFKTMKDLVGYMKANPGKVSFATSGKGAQGHLEAEYIMQFHGLSGIDVPYKSSATSIADTVSNTVSFYITGYGSVAANLAAGRLRALAVGMQARMSQIPEVPTFLEATGIPNYVPTSWFGFVVRTGTPADIVERLEDAVMRTAATPTVRERVQGTGSFMSIQSGKEFGAEMSSESEKIARLINSLNLKND